MNDTSYLEISKSAIKNNVSFIKNIIGQDVELVSVIKGNAYGHGIKYFSPILNEYGVHSFAVFSVYEAEQIIHNNIPFNRLIIMGVLDNHMDWVIQYEIEFFVFTIQRLEKAIASAKKYQKKAKIHLELETGLNRTGLEKQEIPKILKLINKNFEYLSIEGICSHLSGAENISNYVRIKKQISYFQKLIKFFNQQKLDYKTLHLASSAAIINYPKTMLDMVRVGIMQYGFWPSKEVQMAYLLKTNDQVDPLQRVISWKSKVLSKKHVKRGEYIGYGNFVLSEVDMTIAIVPVGYAHGFSRSLSNHGRVLIRGVRYNVIGIVNMNMIIINITSNPNIQIGDEVVLIGNQGENSISVSSFSDLSDQLNYELLTRLPSDLPRVITE